MKDYFARHFFGEVTKVTDVTNNKEVFNNNALEINAVYKKEGYAGVTGVTNSENVTLVTTCNLEKVTENNAINLKENSDLGKELHLLPMLHPEKPVVTKFTSEESYLERFEELAAIAEHIGGLGKEWAEAFAKIQLMKKPKAIDFRYWQNFINDTGRFLDAFVQRAIEEGWQPRDIFCCHRLKPSNRYDCMGLIFLIQSAEIEDITKEKVIVRSKNDLKFTITKSQWRFMPESEIAMIWDVI